MRDWARLELGWRGVWHIIAEGNIVSLNMAGFNSDLEIEHGNIAHREIEHTKGW